MKSINLSSFFVLLLATMTFVTGCASNGYLLDRSRDAADIVSFGVGAGLGAKVRVGPLQTGLLADVPIAGLRGGEFVQSEMIGGFTGHPLFFPTSFDLQCIAVGVEMFADDSLRRNKDFLVSNILDIPSTYRDAFDTGTTNIFTRDPIIPFFHRPAKKSGTSYYYYTQIEVVAGVLGSVRLGFNPGEIVDFLLGWAKIDVFDDDLNKKRPEVK